MEIDVKKKEKKKKKKEKGSEANCSVPLSFSNILTIHFRTHTMNNPVLKEIHISSAAKWRLNPQGSS